jgi:hypothetical protein
LTKAPLGFAEWIRSAQTNKIRDSITQSSRQSIRPSAAYCWPIALILNLQKTTSVELSGSSLGRSYQAQTAGCPEQMTLGRAQLWTSASPYLLLANKLAILMSYGIA